MFHLKLFGGLTLDEDGEILAGPAAQRRRLALLALVGSAPGRTMTRDKVMAMLWPEKDQEQGRHLLSVAVYEIRKVLGEAALATRGHDLVLDADHLDVDVQEFQAALERGELEEATRLYAGPFLDGVHLGGSAELDQWQDGVRADLERRFHNALETLAEKREGAGDPNGAVDAWRKLAASDRYNTRVAIRLIQALAAAGDRAGALRFARVHEQLIAEDMEVEPSPAFLAAIEAVRDTTEVGPEPRSPTPAPGPDLEAPAMIGPGAPPPAAHSAPPSSVPPAATTSRRATWRRWGASPMALPVVGLALVAVFVAIGDWSGQAKSAAGVRIAVMPMEAGYGMTEEDAAYGFGLSQELIDALGAVRGITVKARSASFAMYGAGVQEAARALDVDYVLEGAVRRARDSLRISTQLSDADGRLVWSDRFQLPWGDVFAAWDTVTRAVRTALAIQLGVDAATGAAAVVGGTRDPAAYDYYMRGRYAWWKRTLPGFQQALRYFQQAVDRDSEYALAWTGVSDVYYLMGAFDYGMLPPAAAFGRAREAAERAVALAPQLAQSHAALANVRFGADWDWEGAEASYRRALELDPGFIDARSWYALFLQVTGRTDEAFRQIHRALAQDSLSALIHASVGRQEQLRRDYPAALLAFGKALEIEPGYLSALFGSALAYVELGQTEEALTALDRATEILGQPTPLALALRGHALGRVGQRESARRALAALEALRTDPASPYCPPEYFAIIHVALGEADLAIDELEAAYRAGSSAMAFLTTEPLLDPLRDHPRFRALVARVGVPAPGDPGPASATGAEATR